MSTATVTHGWKAAMDGTIGLADYLRTQIGREHCDAFAADVRDRRKLYGAAALIEALPDQLPPLLYHAEPIWVDENIVDLVQAAAEQWEGEAFGPADLLADNGFVLLEKPLHLKDGMGKVCAFRAFAWSMVLMDGSPGVLMSMWSHVDDVDDYWVGDAERDQMKVRMGRHRLLLLHATPWLFGDDPIDRVGYGTSGGTLPSGILAFLRLAQQRILQRDRIRPDRPYRRQAKRFGNDDPYVTVIQLRRPEGHYEGDPDGEGPEWTHRWIVNGHWRNQRYGRAGEEPTYRRIWIAPFVKGPEDKPLMLRELRAWEFGR